MRHIVSCGYDAQATQAPCAGCVAFRQGVIGGVRARTGTNGVGIFQDRGVDDFSR
jgi:hypothetical protein